MAKRGEVGKLYSLFVRHRHYNGFAGGLSKSYGFEPVESRAQANTVCSIPPYFVEIAQDGEA
jgi:hypothetical protein